MSRKCIFLDKFVTANVFGELTVRNVGFVALESINMNWKEAN